MSLPGGAVRRLPLMSLVFSLAGLLVLLFIILPLLATLVGAGPQAIVDAARQADVQRSLGVTFFAAFIATSIAFVFGLPLAYLLARRDFPGKNLVEGVIDLPIIVPHTAAGIALLMVYGRSGVVGSSFASFSIYFTENVAGIVLAMLFVSVPLFIDGAREAIAAVDPRLEGVARTLGASPWRAVRKVTLPLAWRGILAGGLLMWARGISEFGAIVVLAYNPKVISVLIYERFTAYGLPAAVPVTALLLVFALVLLVVMRAVLLPRGGGRGRRTQ
jgi:molybdate/tungstate transport system permease protein